MDKITRIISILLYAVAMYNFCIDNVQVAIYLILSAIYMNLQLSKDNK